MKSVSGSCESDSIPIHAGCMCDEERTPVFRLILPILLCYLVLSSPSLALGQSTFGSVRGAVQDTSGAVISDTQIVLHSADENTDRTVTADAAGSFVLENVKAGEYSLLAHHNGFAD